MLALLLLDSVRLFVERCAEGSDHVQKFVNLPGQAEEGLCVIDCSGAIRVAELFIGRKLRVSSGDIRLVVVPGITQIYADMPSAVVLTSQSYKVFVDGKLFASVIAYPKRPRLHSPIWLSKDLKSGKMRLRLVKKYTELVSGLGDSKQ